GPVTRATRTFRLSHDAGNNRAPETTRRFVSKERRLGQPSISDLTAGKPSFLGHKTPGKSKLGFKSLNAASARTLCPSTDACHPSIGCSNSARLRSAVANVLEYRN